MWVPILLRSGVHSSDLRLHCAVKCHNSSIAAFQMDPDMHLTVCNLCLTFSLPRNVPARSNVSLMIVFFLRVWGLDFGIMGPASL